MDDTSQRTWRELAMDWKMWLVLIACLLVATGDWLLGYD
jgi:hypothetical protein